MLLENWFGFLSKSKTIPPPSLSVIFFQTASQLLNGINFKKKKKMLNEMVKYPPI